MHKQRHVLVFRIPPANPEPAVVLGASQKLATDFSLFEPSRQQYTSGTIDPEVNSYIATATNKPLRQLPSYTHCGRVSTVFNCPPCFAQPQGFCPGVDNSQGTYGGRWLVKFIIFVLLAIAMAGCLTVFIGGDQQLEAVQKLYDFFTDSAQYVEDNFADVNEAFQGINTELAKIEGQDTESKV